MFPIPKYLNTAKMVSPKATIKPLLELTKIKAKRKKRNAKKINEKKKYED